MKSSHIDADGNAVMVDVSAKAAGARTAVAEGRITVPETVMLTVREGAASKGDVLNVARIAGIMGAKKTPDLIPLCHPLPLSNCRVTLELEKNSIRAVCEVKTVSRTGVEMEALTGVSMALLTVYDMCKSIDKDMEIGDIRLLSKTGGKSGDFSRQ